jgi:thiol-disulfide isomerase/thioredoxin
MTHKKIFILALGLSVFLGAVMAGYFLPDIQRGLGKLQSKQAYHQPSVPDEVVSRFAGIMQKMHVANEPQTLPQEAFYGPDGKPVRFDDLVGDKPLLVNLWAVWCTPCVVELPDLAEFQNLYKDRLEVIGLSFDPGKDEKTLKAFLEKRGVGEFAAYSDKDGALQGKFELRGLPTTFLVGTNGLILYRFEGAVAWMSPESQAFFDAFLFQK